MAESPKVQRRRRPTRKPRRARGHAHALVVIDHERLQAAAWAEFAAVRKRAERVSRDLHRHEQIDMPAFQQWLHRTFPELVTRLREMRDKVADTARKIQMVQARALYFGGTPKRIWRAQKEREEHPERFKSRSQSEPEPDAEPDEGHRRYHATPEDFETASGPAPSLDARAIYRRLVQRLHPDRGGDWTPARERLWHEVQRAWAAADTDWLARLEVEWESAHEVLGPKSPLSVLRRAIEELDAARRDTERKLREYRREPSWQFTRRERHRDVLRRFVEGEIVGELRSLQRELDRFNRIIAAWEEDWTRADVRLKRRR